MGVPSRVSAVIEQVLFWGTWADWDSSRYARPSLLSAGFPQLAVLWNLSHRTRPAPGLEGRVGRRQPEIIYRPAVRVPVPRTTSVAAFADVQNKQRHPSPTP
jgi:hypothetical protein